MTDKNNDIPVILIVDDNPKNLQVLGGLLQREGLDVEFALDGNTAVDWLRKKSFNLVLLDIMMPDMDGYEVCRIIKNDQGLKDLPVIFITAKTDTENIIKGFETGGVDYITKPFIPEELMARVRSQIHIQKSKEKILSYTKEIEIKNRNIKDSIEYARNIQKAVMDNAVTQTTIVPENFVLYLPKDIVSGDFYRYYMVGDICILAVMDCTGHGVPGAFMSILGITLLNEIILYDRILSPEKILESLRDKIMNSLAQNEDKTIVKDGIEGSVVSYDTKRRILSYAGSFNPMLYIHENNMEVIKADRIPIGYFEKKGKFTLKSIQVEKGDIIYLYTDGYIDQFGGPEIRKIMTKGFMVLLQKNHSMPMASQKSVLLDFLNHWKSNMDQIDDILVVGIRF